ncbi:MAG TPA: hypothetical protein VG649_22220 [Candidatus Angelobacter sp.]|nr:hypothetical protein [Candidatus Angelobacter sp.]
MAVVAAIGLQRADVGQFFQKRWKRAQRASFEIILGVEDHSHFLGGHFASGAGKLPQ